MEDINKYYDVFLDHIPEKGVIDFIFDYKILIEDSEIIKNYNENWFLISNSIQDENITENFLLRHIDKIDLILMMSSKREFSETFLTHIFNILPIEIKNNYLNNYNVSLDFMFKHNLIFMNNFFSTYLISKKTKKLLFFSNDEIINILKYVCDFFTKMRKKDITLLFESLLRTQKINISFINFLLNVDDDFLIENFDMDYHFTLEDIKDSLNFDYIKIFYFLSFNNNITYDISFLEKYKFYIDWKRIVQNKYLDEKIIDKFSPMFDWSELSKYINVSENFIRENIHKIHFYNLSINKNMVFSDDFILTYFDLNMINNRLKLQEVGSEIYLNNKSGIDWNLICQYQTLTDKDIIDFYKYIKWDTVVIYQKNISEEMFDKYNIRVNFDILPRYQKLSEGFIKKYRKKINWNYVSQYQKNLTKSFIKKYIKYLDINLVIKYQKNIDLDLIIKNKIDI